MSECALTPHNKPQTASLQWVMAALQRGAKLGELSTSMATVGIRGGVMTVTDPETGCEWQVTVQPVRRPLALVRSRPLGDAA